MDELEFYSSQSFVSDPGGMGKLFDVLPPYQKAPLCHGGGKRLHGAFDTGFRTLGKEAPTFVGESSPTDIKKLCDIVHGLIIHRDDTKNLYGFNPPRERKDEPQTRYCRKILERILVMDNSPLEKFRKPEARFIGVCRDFSLLLCSILRYKKIPARLRCGFASYWEPRLFWDHWVCEYYDKARNRWALADAEVGEEERKFYPPLQKTTGVSPWMNAKCGPSEARRAKEGASADFAEEMKDTTGSARGGLHKISLDHTDIPRDQFFVPGKAWRECRRGNANPDIFGVHVLKNVKGWWFIRGNLLRDTAALNKEELLAWDYPKFYDKPDIKSPADLSKKEITLLDKLAELTGGKTIKFDETISLYRKNRDLQIGEKVTSYTADGPKIVRLKY